MKRKMLVLLIVFLWINFLLLFSNNILAAPIPLSPVTYEETAGVNGNYQTGSDLYTAESVSYTGSGYAYASASGIYPLSAEAGLELYVFAGTATVEINFQFGVESLGDDLPDRVPVNLSAFATVKVDSENAGGGTTAKLLIPGMGDWVVSNYDSGGNFRNGTFFINVDEMIEIDADTAYSVTMRLTTHGQSRTYDFIYNSYAFIDPTFEIDPSFAYSDDYRIVFSEGMSFVPLPGSLLFLCSALIPIVCRKIRRP